MKSLLRSWSISLQPAADPVMLCLIRFAVVELLALRPENITEVY